jgi:hypothetical protein
MRLAPVALHMPRRAQPIIGAEFREHSPPDFQDHLRKVLSTPYA